VTPAGSFSSAPPPQRFHTGHKATPEHKARRFGAPHPVTAAAPFPPAADLRLWTPSCFDQGETETCFAHASATLVFVALAAAGKPLLWVPSPLGIARNTYCEEQPTGLLQDVGADMGDVMTSLSREGVRALGPLAMGRYSDVTPQVITRRPTLADDEQSARELVLGTEQLQPLALDFVPQIATSVANLRCGVSVGIHASPAFQKYKIGDPAIANTNGFTDTDGHDVCALGYRTNPQTGELEIWLLSSWSNAFGDAGGAWVTASWLMGGGALEAWRFAVTIEAAPQAAA
jgi:hypothetical protein